MKAAKTKRAKATRPRSRPYSGPEMRDAFMQTMRSYVHYWATVENPHAGEGQSEIEARLDGLAFSFLNMLDGTTVGLPAFDVVPNPHPSDKKYLAEQGEPHWPRVVINDVLLHELWHGTR